MGLRMDNVVRRGRTWYVRITIPLDVRESFKGKTAVWKSLGIEDENLARELAEVRGAHPGEASFIASQAGRSVGQCGRGMDGLSTPAKTHD